MPAVRSVQKFKDESIDLDARIISAIGSVGPRNVALISRMTGAHQETIRYKIKRRFSNRGFKFQAEVDYAKLGLTLHWGTFQVSPLHYKSAPGLFRALNKVGYLVHFSKILPQGQFVALFALPDGKGPEYAEFLEGLKERKIISDFKLDEVLVERHKPMDPAFYNFQSDRWEVDWQKVKALPGVSLPVGKKKVEHEADEMDLLIIKELQRDALQHIVGVAKKLKIHEKTLEYHYRTHVVKRRLISHYRVRWMKDLDRTLAHSAVISRMTFRGLEGGEFRKVQSAVSKIPFLWVEDLLKDGTYVATLDIPLTHFIETGIYLNEELQFLGSKAEVGYFRPGDSMNFTIPYEAFANGEWNFDAARIEASVIRELSGAPKK
jgi:DNA-binding Lrp family transcriptional regulator